jgi:hypothetical protein
MSLALQRVVVRLLHDPHLERATTGAALSATEMAWLKAVDPRRWRADPMRRYRLLQALIEEYPVAAAQVVRADGVPALDRFFESADFHQSVQARKVLALDFGTWLTRRAICADAARLERAIAIVRRTPRRPRPGDATCAWRRAPWIAVGRGNLEGWQRLRQALAAHPGGILAGVLDIDCGLPDAAGPTEDWLVDGGSTPHVEALVPALAEFLRGLDAPVSWSDLQRRLVDLGADQADVPELLDDFIRDELLTPSAD